MHSGCTQEYYSNRIDLDDHAEDVLSFEFGVKSLTRLALEVIIVNLNEFDNDSLREEVPTQLYETIHKRVYRDFDMLYPLTASSVSTTSPLLDRKNVLHKGI